MDKKTAEIDEELYRALLKHAESLIICLSDDFKILELNSKAEAIFGLKKREAIDKSFLDLCEEKQIECPVNADIFFEEQRKKKEITTRTIKPNGDKIFIQWKILPLPQNKMGLIGRDITELKTAEEKIFSLGRIIKYAPGIIYWKDKNSIHLGCNDTFAEWCGLSSADDVVGKTDYELWPGQGDSYRKDDQDVILSGKPKLNIEDRLPAVGDKVSYVTTNKVPLRDIEGHVVGVLGTAADITEQKRIEAELKFAKERAEKSSEAKSQFIANMSHDLRTPLNGILGMAQVLEMNEADSEKQIYIQDIISSSQRLTNLLNEILEISQIESGKLPVRLVEFEPKILVEDMFHLFKTQAEQKQIKFFMQFDDKIPSFVLGDKHRLHRILLNLLGNAVKFTETGYVKLAAKFKTQKQGQVVLQFSVKDTGMGIPEDKFGEIFEKFSRLDPAYKGQYQGVGLGLGIVKQMTEEIGGSISVRSEIGKGSTFACTMPFETVRRKGRVLAKNTKENKNVDIFLTRLKNLKVLLVEDDKICQRVIQGILKGTGFTLDIADNVAKARKLLGEFEYDIIFMDIGLPDGDGIEFTKEIRQQMKIAVPIIATTAHVGKERKDECLASGMNEYITKPVEAAAVKKALLHWVKKKKK